MFLRSIWWENGRIKIVDQTKLPHELSYVYLNTLDDVEKAIVNMMVRGAPLIGITGALGLALVAYKNKDLSGERLLNVLKEAYNRLRSTRPTAVNLVSMMNRVMEYAHKNPDPQKIVDFVRGLVDEDIRINERIAEIGSSLIKNGDKILTHCNTGSLATVSIGTALGIILKAYEEGKQFEVFITETRPKLQGSRITAFELIYAGLKPTLIVDSAVAHTIKSKKITKIVVGADRILLDGTTYNKIGTYQIAIAANYHHIPFYVAAPLSTIDPISSPDDVIIEERDPEEVRNCLDCSIAPKEVNVFNPAFDETPPSLISGIVTEKGIAYPPFEVSLKNFISIK